MDLVLATAVYGAVVATAAAGWSVYVYRRDRERIETQARYVPEVQSYVIEVCNEGRRPVSITAAGISVYPEGYGNKNPAEVLLARDQLPTRLLEGDCTYIGVQASYDPKHMLWIRDAHGHRTIHLVSPPSPDGSQYGSESWLNLTVAQRAELFNRPVEHDRVAEMKRRLSVIEAEVEILRLRATHDEQKRIQKQSSRTTKKDM